jgi:hypothetical protein
MMRCLCFVTPGIANQCYRLVVRRQDVRVRLYTRRGYDWSDRFAALSAATGGLEAASRVIDKAILHLRMTNAPRWERPSGGLVGLLVGWPRPGLRIRVFVAWDHLFNSEIDRPVPTHSAYYRNRRARRGLGLPRPPSTR